jgi:hypothetical protein
MLRVILGRCKDSAAVYTSKDVLSQKRHHKFQWSSINARLENMASPKDVWNIIHHPVMVKLAHIKEIHYKLMFNVLPLAGRTWFFNKRRISMPVLESHRTSSTLSETAGQPRSFGILEPLMPEFMIQVTGSLRPLVQWGQFGYHLGPFFVYLKICWKPSELNLQHIFREKQSNRKVPEKWHQSVIFWYVFSGIFRYILSVYFRYVFRWLSGLSLILPENIPKAI